MENETLAISESPGPDPVLRLIQKVIDGGVTETNVAALDKLLGVYERLEAKQAERRFNEAFVALQSELPVIVASTIIPNRGKYEKFEDVCRIVSPLLVKHGFTVSFSMEANENRILETCHLKHIGGHAQSNSFAVRAGGKSDSDTQADCKAATTAKRNALLNCLNIVIRQDAFNEEQDDTQDGSPINWEQVAYLKEQVKATGADEAAFLKFAGVHDYPEIGSARYDSLVAALAKKARK
jgi:hypothetical protein